MCDWPFDPLLSLGCASCPPTLAQSKERKGSNFAIWQPWARGAGDLSDLGGMQKGPSFLIVIKSYCERWVERGWSHLCYFPTRVKQSTARRGVPTPLIQIFKTVRVRVRSRKSSGPSRLRASDLRGGTRVLLAGQSDKKWSDCTTGAEQSQ